MTLFASKKGRPRKQGVSRFPSGQIKPEAITATAEEARIRQLLGVDVWREARRDEKALAEARKRVSNPLLGFALGRLLYGQEITRKQYGAGLYWIGLYRAFAVVSGLPDPNPQGANIAVAVPRETGDADADVDRYARMDATKLDPDRAETPEERQEILEAIDEIKRDFRTAYRFIFDANGDHGRTTGPIFEILKRTLVEDIGPQNATELGNLRIGLNAINQARGV